jgi:uncharacterized phage protein (TIGR01671 family)
MREYKFRAWDKKEKLMSIGMSLDWFITGEDADMEFTKTDESLPLRDFISYKSDFTLMQFTGRLYKDQSEIYESDLVIAKKANSGLGDMNDIYEVRWNNDYSMWGLFCVKSDNNFRIGKFCMKSNGQPYILSNAISKVGNIYESPNLLP